MHRDFRLLFPFRAATLFLVLILIALLAACTPDNPQSTFGAAGSVAEDQARLFEFIFWIAVVIFILVEGAVIYAAIRFRRRSDNDELPHQTHGNDKLEIAWTIIPALVLIAIAVPTLIDIWAQQNGVPDDQGDVLSVEAIGHQWWFEFRYPDYEIITSNELHIPVDRPVAFKLESQDVIHSFWVPKIAGKVDMVPLHENYMWMTGTEVGEFYGQCAEFCGIAHAHMRFRVFVHTEEDFLVWTEGMHTAPDALQPGSAEAVGQQLFAGNCSSCHTNNSTSPGSYAREISSQQTRWNGWVSDIENSAIVSAPNLTHFGTRKTIGAGLKGLNHESLVGWITDPSSIKIGTRMQEHAVVYDTADGTANLSTAEISDIATYLLSLKPGSGSAVGSVESVAIDGATVFATNCTSCHSTTDSTAIGPSLAGIADRAGSRIPGMSAEEYLVDSITNPGNFIVDGYPAVMPEWGHLGNEIIDALITYLKTLK